MRFAEPAGSESRPDGVRAQYEIYPYPPRNPDEERHRLIVGSPSHIDEITHYCFGGRLPSPFRALIAGGGTGDGLIMLAAQLAARQIPAEITYLDLSTASRAIAEARAAARGLSSIRFLTGSLLDLANLAPGPYDYIDCCGVLHHLTDPAAGLRALASILAAEGGMGLMLYGSLGRTGVYPMQQALRLLGAGLNPEEQVQQAKRLLAALPESNWLSRNIFMTDHLRGEDAALYDLLLHSTDRAYTVPDIYALLSANALSITGFIEPAKYNPRTWLKDDTLRMRAAALPLEDQYALAENLSGAMSTHVFYAVPNYRAAKAVAGADSPSAIPVLREIEALPLARRLSKGGELKISIDTLPLAFAIPDGVADIAACIDGKRTLGEIQAALNLDWIAFKARFDRLYQLLNPLNLLLLRR